MLEKVQIAWVDYLQQCSFMYGVCFRIKMQSPTVIEEIFYERCCEDGAPEMPVLIAAVVFIGIQKQLFYHNIQRISYIIIKVVRPRVSSLNIIKITTRKTL